MIVTRHFPAKNGQSVEFPTVLGPYDSFCDWLSLSEEYPPLGQDSEGRLIPPLPVVNGGHVVVIDPAHVVDDGEWLGFPKEAIEKTRQAYLQIEGSYSERVQVRCDGFRVELSGNVGRFGRPDNLFGYSVQECAEIASQIVQKLGLPAFTVKAVISRVDLTRNYQAGSRGDALRILSYYSTQARGRQSPRFYNNGVTWGEGSRRWYAKIYYKPDSLGSKITPQVAKWAEQVGLLRDEISLKATWLGEEGLKHFGAWARQKGDQKMENIIYGRFSDVIYRGAVNAVPFEEIPGHLGRIARDYAAGNDVWGDPTYAERTKRRWRSALLRYGIDIREPSNVRALSVRPRVICMTHCERPEWYSFNRAA